jgi:hypothetical protein
VEGGPNVAEVWRRIAGVWTCLVLETVPLPGAAWLLVSALVAPGVGRSRPSRRLAASTSGGHC